MFYVGMKVVCVDASPMYYGEHSGLTKGQIYTVSGIEPVRDINGHTGLHIAEVKTAPLRREYRDSYRSNRFRPVVERKTSIAIFEAMLNPSDKRVEA